MIGFIYIRRCKLSSCHHFIDKMYLRPRSYFSDEALTCNVCDRTFPNQRQLESHQQKKRHFGCSTCDSLYLSLMALEHHKEEFQHWSDDDEYCSAGYDSDSSEDTMPSEDCERLL